MNTYSINKAKGAVTIDADGTEITLINQPVTLTYDKNNHVSIIHPYGEININVTKDTLAIKDEDASTDNTYTPGSQSGLQVRSLLRAVFPKANSGSGGSGNAAVEGLDLYLYSHSYGVLQSPANCSPNKLYEKLVFNRLKFGALYIRSNSGYFAQDVAGVMMNGANSFVPGSTGVVILDCIQNDLRVGTTGGVMAAANLNGFKHSLRAMLWYLRCSSILQQTDASFVYSGTWTTLTTSWFMNGSLTQTTVNGATATIIFTGTDCVLFSRATNGAQAGANITVDGVQKATITNPGQQCVTSTSTLAATSAPVAIPLLNLGAGTHTIVVTNTGGGGGTIFIDAIGAVSPAPTQVLVHKQVYLPDVAYTYWANGANNATVDAINAVVDSIIAEFPNDGSVKAVDMNANGWDRTTMTHSVNFGHPNDRGMIKIADTDVLTLANIPYRTGMNVL